MALSNPFVGFFRTAVAFDIAAQKKSTGYCWSITVATGGNDCFEYLKDHKHKSNWCGQEA